MKKKIITITFVLIAVIGTITWAFRRSGPNFIRTVDDPFTYVSTDWYVQNSPTNAILESRKVMRIRDSSYWKVMTNEVIVTRLNSTVNESNPSSIIWSSDSGTLHRTAINNFTLPSTQITGLATVATSGSYADLSGKPTIKRTETYSGTTNASGTYTVTYGSAFSSTPVLAANIIGGTDTQFIRITASSATGFTVLVRNRTDALGLLPSYSNVNGATVNITVTEN